MRSFALWILLLSGIHSISQNCNNTLSGFVLDLHDGSRLSGATLIVAGTQQAVVSDLDGNYTIPNLCDNSYNIQVSHPYCLTRGFSVKISGNTTKTLKLEHHLEELNQVTLEGKAYGVKSNNVLGKI